MVGSLRLFHTPMATIKDVALLAGVGLGTASRAISGHGAISAKTLARVQLAVASLNFKPSRVARALSSRSLGLVGVYVPTFEGTYFAPILQAIDGELRLKNHHMVAASSFGHGKRHEKSLNGINFLIDRQCDGILAVDTYILDSDLLDIKNRIKHLVLMNRNLKEMENNCFSVDHVAAGRLAARALLSQGHFEIAAMHSLRHGSDVIDRMTGFKLELAAQGIKLNKEFIIDGLLNFTNGWGKAGEICSLRKRKFTALFCVNDVLAMATLSRLREAGIEVPKELSILGYDDAEMAAYTSPALSTIRVPSAQIAASACRYLMNLCYASGLEVQRHFEAEFIARRSIALGPHPSLI